MRTSVMPASMDREGECSIWREQRTKHGLQGAHCSPWATQTVDQQGVPRKQSCCRVDLEGPVALGPILTSCDSEILLVLKIFSPSI